MISDICAAWIVCGFINFWIYKDSIKRKDRMSSFPRAAYIKSMLWGPVGLAFTLIRTKGMPFRDNNVPPAHNLHDKKSKNQKVFSSHDEAVKAVNDEPTNSKRYLDAIEYLSRKNDKSKKDEDSK